MNFLHRIVIYIMIIPTSEQHQIMNRFPTIEFSYVKHIHKKVQCDLYVVIPYGLKYLVWFSFYKQHRVAFFLNYPLHT